MSAQTPLITTLIDPADVEFAVPVTALTRDDLEAWLEAQAAPVRHWVDRLGFTADSGAYVLIPDRDGGVERVVVGLGDGSDPWALAGLTTSLPRGDYRLDPAPEDDRAFWACFAWEMGAYGFTRYKSAASEGSAPQPARLVWPEGVDRRAVERAAAGTTLTRDLINMPAADLGPEELEDAARALADAHGATIDVIVGEALERANYPAIYAVGKAARARRAS